MSVGSRGRKRGPERRRCRRKSRAGSKGAGAGQGGGRAGALPGAPAVTGGGGAVAAGGVTPQREAHEEAEGRVRAHTIPGANARFLTEVIISQGSVVDSSSSDEVRTPEQDVSLRHVVSMACQQGIAPNTRHAVYSLGWSSRLSPQLPAHAMLPDHSCKKVRFTKALILAG